MALPYIVEYCNKNGLSKVDAQAILESPAMKLFTQVFADLKRDNEALLLKITDTNSAFGIIGELRVAKAFENLKAQLKGFAEGTLAPPTAAPDPLDAFKQPDELKNPIKVQ